MAYTITRFFSFTLTKFNIVYHHHMGRQVALEGFNVIRVDELGDLIE